MKGNKSSLKRLERRTYLMYHRDGITDLGLGILVLLFGIGMKYDQTLIAPIYGCLGYPIWIFMKQWITEKRLGYVEFGEARKTREKKGWILLFLLGSLVFLLGIMSYILVTRGGATGIPGLRGYLMISVIFAVLISSVGLVLDLYRLHLYSVMLLFSGATGQLMQWRPETGVILPGTIITLTGLVLLISFLMKYPKTAAEPVSFTEENGDVET